MSKLNLTVLRRCIPKVCQTPHLVTNGFLASRRKAKCLKKLLRYDDYNEALPRGVMILPLMNDFGFDSGWAIVNVKGENRLCSTR